MSVDDDAVDLVAEAVRHLEWTKDFASVAKDQYLKFLRLKCREKDFTTSQLAPSTTVAFVWSLHRAWTQDYQKVCADLGGFIHHSPRAMTNISARQEAYARTLRLYQDVFGEKPPQLCWEPFGSPSNGSSASKQYRALGLGYHADFIGVFPSKVLATDPANEGLGISSSSLPLGGAASDQASKATPSGGRSEVIPPGLSQGGANVLAPISSQGGALNQPLDVPTQAVYSTVLPGQPMLVNASAGQTRASLSPVGVAIDHGQNLKSPGQKIRLSTAERALQKGLILRPLGSGEKRSRGRPRMSDYMKIEDLSEEQRAQLGVNIAYQGVSSAALIGHISAPQPDGVGSAEAPAVKPGFTFANIPGIGRISFLGKRKRGRPRKDSIVPVTQASVAQAGLMTSGATTAVSLPQPIVEASAGQSVVASGVVPVVQGSSQPTSQHIAAAPTYTQAVSGSEANGFFIQPHVVASQSTMLSGRSTGALTTVPAQPTELPGNRTETGSLVGVVGTESHPLSSANPTESISTPASHVALHNTTELGTVSVGTGTVPRTPQVYPVASGSAVLSAPAPIAAIGTLQSVGQASLIHMMPMPVTSGASSSMPPVGTSASMSSTSYATPGGVISPTVNTTAMDPLAAGSTQAVAHVATPAVSSVAGHVAIAGSNGSAGNDGMAMTSVAPTLPNFVASTAAIPEAPGAALMSVGNQGSSASHTAPFPGPASAGIVAPGSVPVAGQPICAAPALSDGLAGPASMARSSAPAGTTVSTSVVSPPVTTAGVYGVPPAAGSTVVHTVAPPQPTGSISGVAAAQTTVVVPGSAPHEIASSVSGKNISSTAAGLSATLTAMPSTASETLTPPVGTNDSFAVAASSAGYVATSASTNSVVAAVVPAVPPAATSTTAAGVPVSGVGVSVPSVPSAPTIDMSYYVLSGAPVARLNAASTEHAAGANSSTSAVPGSGSAGEVPGATPHEVIGIENDRAAEPASATPVQGATPTGISPDVECAASAAPSVAPFLSQTNSPSMTMPPGGEAMITVGASSGDLVSVKPEPLTIPAVTPAEAVVVATADTVSAQNGNPVAEAAGVKMQGVSAEKNQ